MKKFVILVELIKLPYAENSNVLNLTGTNRFFFSIKIKSTSKKKLSPCPNDEY